MLRRPKRSKNEVVVPKEEQDEDEKHSPVVTVCTMLCNI